MTRRISLGCMLGALLAVWVGACQQTLVLDAPASDGGLPGTGGKGGSSAGGRGGGSGGNGGGEPTDASADGRCFGGQGPQIQFNADTPQIVVALDRSSSMNEPFGTNGLPQLQVALNAILGEVDGYSGKSNRRIIQFAFLDFPDDTSKGCNATIGCCPSEVTSTYTELEQEANACNDAPNPSCLQSMSRPISQALSKAHDYYASSGNGSQHNTERDVILLTDGDPAGTCPSTNPNANPSDNPCTDAINAIGDLSYLGVTTEVVAIGSDADCLPSLATAEGISPSPYYVAVIPSDLPNLLDGIAQTVVLGGCHLTLATPPSGQLTVMFDGVVQPQDVGTTGNGWNYSSISNNTRVFLHGTLCQSYLQGSPNSPFGLQIYDSCAPSHVGQTP